MAVLSIHLVWDVHVHASFQSQAMYLSSVSPFSLQVLGYITLLVGKRCAGWVNSQTWQL